MPGSSASGAAWRRRRERRADRPGARPRRRSAVFHRELDRGYPLIVRGQGMWLIDAAGNRYLDAVGGEAMVSSIGVGVSDVVAAAERQLREIGFIYNQQFTSPAQEELARRLIALAPGYSRVHFASGGAEANETLLRLARAYHVERGEPERWNVISFAQAYHGPTMATLALTGRPGLQTRTSRTSRASSTCRLRRTITIQAATGRSRRSSRRSMLFFSFAPR